MARQEYPRPQFVRDEWQCLNGSWMFSFDDEQKGQSEHWERQDTKFSKTIEVPFVFQSELSGIADKGIHDHVWYKRTCIIPNEWMGKDILLHFGAVDYQAKVFVNGFLVGEHTGGHVGFTLTITNYVNIGENDITVYVYDPSEDETIPRGKQTWEKESRSIWYTRTTGIWQSVWLEPVSKIRIDRVAMTPFLDEGAVEFQIETIGTMHQKNISVLVIIDYNEENIVTDRIAITHQQTLRRFDLYQQKIFRTEFHHAGFCWTPENPNLMNVRLALYQDDVCLDDAKTYFGMRKVHTENGLVYLNNRPIYQKLILDQGYWPQSLLTAPSDEAYIQDIEAAKAMGFNGCRKHQKVEDPRFLYWADKLGYLVWGEIASCPVYTNDAATRLMAEFAEAVRRDYNHPCIVAWVPLNESWGVPHIRNNKKEQHHSLTMYHMIHSLDDTRLVISNDGWQMTKTDICAIHNYNHGNAEQKEKYDYFEKSLKTVETILQSKPSGRNMYADGFTYEGEPMLLTEFGGVAYDVERGDGWGYTVATSQEAFLEDLRRIIRAIYASSAVAGFCYTQMTDVEQEINGLLTYDRKPKAPYETIKQILDGWNGHITH